MHKTGGINMSFSRELPGASPGVIRGDGGEAKCWVSSETEFSEGIPAEVVSREIVELDKPLPDGHYVLKVDGLQISVRLLDGSWEIPKL